MKKLKKIHVFFLLIILLLTMYIIIRSAVPFGIGGFKQIIAYNFFSRYRGKYVSPDGSKEIIVVTNDGGAMHSGNFPTWIIAQHWWGKNVVTKGYLRNQDGDVPISWIGPRTFKIIFAESRKPFCQNDNIFEITLE